jgi:hypothetical protein
MTDVSQGMMFQMTPLPNCSYEESEPEQGIDHESYLVRSPLEAGTNPLPAGFFRVFHQGF